MDIEAKITKVKYTPLLAHELKEYNLSKFDINECPASFILVHEKASFAISKWISPKRTRSYPYERVYNTLGYGKKITIIPIIKDEGADGDRDFIQWDTISMMSLLDTYVVLAYYDKAEKNEDYKNKITNQKFNNDYIIEKIKEISNFLSSALHWNMQELENSFPKLIEKVKSSYFKISEETKVKMHHTKGIERFHNIIVKNVDSFKNYSRQKAEEAQKREYKTLQPKESLKTQTKSKITILNYLGGQYFLTTDEIKIDLETTFLIESKHTKSGVLPSESDIKDGLLKMILYSNLENIMVEGMEKRVIAVLQLTSPNIQMNIDSKADSKTLEEFKNLHQLKDSQMKLLETLFYEANENDFLVTLQNG